MPTTDSPRGARRRWRRIPAPRRTLGFVRNWWKGLLADISLMHGLATADARASELGKLLGSPTAPAAAPKGITAAEWTARIERARRVLSPPLVEPEEQAWLKARTAVDERLTEIEEAIAVLADRQPGGESGTATALRDHTSIRAGNDRLRAALSSEASNWPDARRWREARAAVDGRLSEIEELVGLLDGDEQLWLALKRERSALRPARRYRAWTLLQRLPNQRRGGTAIELRERAESELLLREAVRARNGHLRRQLLALRSPGPPNWREIRSATSERLFEIEALMPLLASDQQLRQRLEVERDEAAPSLPKALREQAATLLSGSARVAPLTAVRRSEAELLVGEAVRARNYDVREEQAAAAARVNYMTWMALILGGLLILTSAAVILTDAINAVPPRIFLAATAGALGGTLSGMLTIRTPRPTLLAVERLGPGAVIQPILGGVGGLMLYGIWQSGVVDIPSLKKHEWAAIAAVAFAGGFSEPLLFKSLKRLTGEDAPASTTNLAAAG